MSEPEEKFKGYVSVRMNPKASKLWNAVMKLDDYALKTDADVLFYMMQEVLKGRNIDVKKLIG